MNTAARLQAVAPGREIVLGPTAWRKTSELLAMRGIESRQETVELRGIGAAEIRGICTA